MGEEQHEWSEGEGGMVLAKVSELTAEVARLQSKLDRRDSSYGKPQHGDYAAEEHEWSEGEEGLVLAKVSELTTEVAQLEGELAKARADVEAATGKTRLAGDQEKEVSRRQAAAELERALDEAGKAAEEALGKALVNAADRAAEEKTMALGALRVALGQAQDMAIAAAKEEARQGARKEVEASLRRERDMAVAAAVAAERVEAQRVVDRATDDATAAATGASREALHQREAEVEEVWAKLRAAEAREAAWHWENGENASTRRRQDHKAQAAYDRKERECGTLQRAVDDLEVRCTQLHSELAATREQVRYGTQLRVCVCVFVVY